MDFSKVRLADFAQARLRDVAAPKAKPAAADTSTNVPTSPKSVSHASDVCAHAPQYTVKLAPLISDAVSHAEQLESIELDAVSGYVLAVADEGLLIWRKGADNSLLFPLPAAHAVSAKLVPAAADAPSAQPGLVTLDRRSGHLTFWESVNRAVSTASDLGPVGAGTARIPLKHNELVEIVETVEPFGLVATTNLGHFYLVNLRDDIGKRNVSVHQMRAGGGFLARLRSFGALARDITSVRRGNLLNNNSIREVYIANRYGDVAVWHVGLNGLAELVDEIRVGTKLNMQMDMLYPNSQISLLVHDLAVESSYTHFLASFEPLSDSKLRYFVVMSLTADFDVVSVRRLQSYESVSGDVSDATSLHVGNGVLLVASSDAVVLVDSPSKAPQAGSAGLTRWEESLALKQDATMLGSASNPNGSVTVSTSMGIMSFAFHDAANFESTTKARLEQAVFESSPHSPLDLKKWSEFESAPDPEAAQKLALEIANSQTPYVPAQLPELSAHLELRISKLVQLYKQAPLPEVREIGQTVVAGAALYRFYETLGSSSGTKSIIETSIQAVQAGSLRELLLNNTSLVPDVLNSIVGAAPKAPEVAQLILSVFQASVDSGMGLQRWATEGQLRQALESLTAQAVEAKDANVLALTTEILCAIYSDPRSEQETQSGTIKQLLYELSQLDKTSERAISIASEYRVYSALAPLEVGSWLNASDAQSTEFAQVTEHISTLGVSYATAVFDACITSGNSSALVKYLAPLYPDLVNEYLTSNGLSNIAWTLNPGTTESTERLKAAASDAQTLGSRRIYASLYKISAYVTGTGDLSTAQKELDLVTAQESLSHQLQQDVVSSSPLTSSSALVRHGLEQLHKVVDHQTAVDLLAMAPPQAVPENNSNFVLGFKLVDTEDIVRQRLLVQQLVCNTNWDRVSTGDAVSQAKRLRQTLFYHTLQSLHPDNREKLYDFRSSLVAPDRQSVRESYPWDIGGEVVRELESIAQRAVSIADKYHVDDFVRELGEGQMDVDL